MFIWGSIYPQDVLRMLVLPRVFNVFMIFTDDFATFPSRSRTEVIKRVIKRLKLTVQITRLCEGRGGPCTAFRIPMFTQWHSYSPCDFPCSQKGPSPVLREHRATPLLCLVQQQCCARTLDYHCHFKNPLPARCAALRTPPCSALFTNTPVKGHLITSGPSP